MSAPKFVPPAPGSWQLPPDSSTGFVFVEGVAQPMRCGSGRRARFVAAAPELYEALAAMLAQVEDWHASTGHAEPGSLQCDALCTLMPRARAALAKAAQP